jgi:putative addiction module CopG family antidote
MGVTSIRLRPEIEGPLEALAAKRERSKNYIINQAIKEYLARQSAEDARWSETLEALSSIEQGRSFPEADVKAWLDDWITSRIAAGEFTNDSEYIRDLIRRDQTRIAAIEEIRAALLAGEASGVSDKTPEEVRQAVRDRLRHDGRLPPE